MCSYEGLAVIQPVFAITSCLLYSMPAMDSFDLHEYV